jgi:hypothetical protein
MFAGTFTNRYFAGFFVSFTTLVAAGTAVGQSSSRYEGMAEHHSRSVSYGYGGYDSYHASTAAEGFLRGRAAVIDALGNFEVNDAQAGILCEQGRALVRENNLKQTEALLIQKKMWEDARFQARKDRDARIAEGKQVLAERRATVYRDAYQLSAEELNIKTGQIVWPEALQDSRFEASRARLEELFRQHVGYGVPRANVAREIARNIDQWSHVLRNEVGSMSREDYLAAQKFLLGLKYGAASVVVAS